MTVAIPLLVSAIVIASAYVLAPRWPKRSIPDDALRSIVIPAYTTHARHLPKPSRHAFSYPLLYLGVDIDSLQTGLLDLPGRLLRYGGAPWSKILGIRSDGYLQPGTGSLRYKLERLLSGQGVAREEVLRAWLVTMPSFLGFEGINPLSVWYVYNANRELHCVVLEVHNTFGEKHAYVLKEDSEHRHDPAEGYDLAWTFPRSFHVSPFNSRNGYYRLDLVDPFSAYSRDQSRTMPQIKVFLRLLTPSKECKLQAILASSPSRSSVPIDSGNVFNMVFTILRFPFALLLTTPRILYQAYRLHYERDLAVYPRPEPKSAGSTDEWNAPEADQEGLGVAIGWQAAGWAERTAQEIVSGLIAERTTNSGLSIAVEFLDQRTDLAFGSEDASERVHIRTADPKLFTNLLLAPSPRHFTALAPELLTTISDPELFVRFFRPITTPHPTCLPARLADSLRHSFFVFLLSHSLLAPTPDLWTYSIPHFTDTLPVLDQWRAMLVVLLASTADRVEERIMCWLGASFVEGREPWKLWERALRRSYLTQITPDSSSEEWTVVEKGNLGSIRIIR